MGKDESFLKKFIPILKEEKKKTKGLKERKKELVKDYFEEEGMSILTSNKKYQTTLYLKKELVEAAKMMDLNISETTNKALLEEIRTSFNLGKSWLEHENIEVDFENEDIILTQDESSIKISRELLSDLTEHPSTYKKLSEVA